MIYLISGLGADERVFKFLNLGNQSFSVIRWEIPANGESLATYSLKLIKQIDTEKEIILIGVSFGGIVAQEIAGHIPVKKLIIISSIKSPDELHWKLRLVRVTGIHKLLPAGFMKQLGIYFADYFFSVETNQELFLLREIMLDTDANFSKWAVGNILQWKGNRSGITPMHIHGVKDRILSCKTFKNYIPIADGGHFMIVNRSEQISKLVRNLI